MSQRNILLLVNSSRAQAEEASDLVISILEKAKINVYRTIDSQLPELELVLVLGGD